MKEILKCAIWMPEATKGKDAGVLPIPPDASIARATDTMRLLSHPERLRVLCHLAIEGELSVGELLERIELSGSALSQHLAKMRSLGLVATRKDRQVVYYRIDRNDVHRLLEVLHELYCD